MVKSIDQAAEDVTFALFENRQVAVRQAKTITLLKLIQEFIICNQTLVHAAIGNSYQRSAHYQSSRLVNEAIRGSSWRVFDATCQIKILLLS